MRHRRWTALATLPRSIIWLLGPLTLLAFVATATVADAFSCESAEQELVALTNADRTSNGLPSLRPRDDLAAVARERSNDMATRNYFSHEIPPANNYFEALLETAGITYHLAGENIARNNRPETQTVRQAQTGFMNSPAHRANILEPGYQAVGVGVTARPDGMKYYTVLFLAPADEARTGPARLAGTLARLPQRPPRQPALAERLPSAAVEAVAGRGVHAGMPTPRYATPAVAMLPAPSVTRQRGDC
jgi:uncharacterized protein YkwD